MGKRLISFAVAAVMAVSTHALVTAQQGGLNTPVLPGLPADPADPLAMYKSDVLQQRQLEPDISGSTRNHLHLMTFFNDYRAVHLPGDSRPRRTYASRGLKGVLERVVALVTGSKPAKPALPAKALAAEARIGLSRSYDGGLTWHGGLLPKIDGLDAMTDPKTAVGTVRDRIPLADRFHTRRRQQSGRLAFPGSEQSRRRRQLGEPGLQHRRNRPKRCERPLPRSARDRRRSGAHRDRRPVRASRLSGMGAVPGRRGRRNAQLRTDDRRRRPELGSRRGTRSTSRPTRRPSRASRSRSTRVRDNRTRAAAEPFTTAGACLQTPENPNGIWITSSKDFGASVPESHACEHGRDVPVRSADDLDGRRRLSIPNCSPSGPTPCRPSRWATGNSLHGLAGAGGYSKVAPATRANRAAVVRSSGGGRGTPHRVDEIG